MEFELDLNWPRIRAKLISLDGVTKIIPLKRTEVMQLRDGEKYKEESLLTTSEAIIKTRLPSSLSSSSNPFASKLRSSSKFLSSSSSTSIDTKSKSEPCLNESVCEPITRFSKSYVSLTSFSSIYWQPIY